MSTFTLDPAAQLLSNSSHNHSSQSINLDESEFLDWNENQVSSWITNLPCTGKDPRIGTKFLENNIDGSVLPYLTTQNLKEIGVENLSTRLSIKKSISELIIHQFNSNSHKLDFKLDVNDNHVKIEIFNLSVKLLSDIVSKVSENLQNQSKSPSSDTITLSTSNPEIRKINDNIAKLKNELLPVIKYVKDLKPLPTSDQANFNESLKSPSVTSPANFVTSPTQSITSFSGNNNTITYPPSLTPTTLKSMNRVSSSSLISMGTGKVVQQSILKPELNKVKSETSLSRTINSSNSTFSTMPNSGKKDYFSPTNAPSPTYSIKTNSTLQAPPLQHHQSSSSLPRSSTNGFGSSSQQQQQDIQQREHYQQEHQHMVDQDHDHDREQQKQEQNQDDHQDSQDHDDQEETSQHHHHQQQHQPSHTEPLKQLRASSEDSCHKVLQQAMKRHHIPRDDWGKYVLVVCYGDKERILKLNEKPVLIFRELQEMGKHPAIMLRQLAQDIGENHGESRIGDEIPGGRL